MGDPATIQNLEIVFARVLSVALTLVAAGTIVMIIIGGFGFLTAGGDKEATTRARHTLTFAIAGLIVSVSAWIIIQLLGSFLGANFNTFSLRVTP
jgi:hypothetical protein